MCRHHGQFIEGECVVTMDRIEGEFTGYEGECVVTMDRFNSLLKENVSSPWAVLIVDWRRMCCHHGQFIEGECVVTMDS